MGPRFLWRHVVAARGGAAPVPVSVRGVGDVLVRRGSADLGIVREIFREDQYRIPSAEHDARVDAVYQEILARGRTPLIIDAGANNGASARWFAGRYPRAAIVAVEPDPENARMCRQNTAGADVEVREAAIGSRGGRVSLTGDRCYSDAFRTTRDGAGETQVLTVGEIVAERAAGHDLFAVKVDIEGFESDLFAEATEWLDRVSLLYVEPHDYLFPGRGVTLGLQTAVAGRDFELLLSRENLVYVRR